MRAKLIESNKPEHYIHPVRNVDTTPAALTIPTGSPLILNLSATPQPPTPQNGPPGWEDGIQVVLPATAGTANCNLFYYGIATGPIIYPALGESLVHGVGMALVVRATRSATTVPWASIASVSNADQALTIDTVNNAFGTAASSASAWYVLLDNLTTMASSATNATDTRLAVTQLARSFVRIM